MSIGIRNEDAMFVPQYDLKTLLVCSEMSQDASERLHIHIERVKTVLRLLNKLPHSRGILTVGYGGFKVFNVEVSSVSTKSVHEITRVSVNP